MVSLADNIYIHIVYNSIEQYFTAVSFPVKEYKSFCGGSTVTSALTVKRSYK